MVEREVATAISIGVSLLGILLFVRLPYRSYRRDVLRDELFGVRRDLFLLAASGKIRFDHPAYWILRSTMNGFLRFAHRMTLPGLCWFSVLVGRGDLEAIGVIDHRRQWGQAVQQLPADLRREIRQLESRMHLAVYGYLVKSSIVLIALVVPLILLLVASMVAGSFVMTSISRCFRPLDSAALAVGEDRLRLA